MSRYRLDVIYLLAGLVTASALPQESSLSLACDREMRKTLESIQAWRRLHDGRYPGRLVDLKDAGFLPQDGAICPEMLREGTGADAAHQQITSRGETGDPYGTYEYEMSTVLKSEDNRFFLPRDAPSYTRQDLKAALLRRPFFEQVPILRCSSHRAAAPQSFAGSSDVRRNATVSGQVYWSGTYWEQIWLDNVPYCAREANVLFGLKGPPFHTDRRPDVPGSLDLRKWSCAFGDHAWWWAHPMFEERASRQKAAHLGPFFEENHGRRVQVGTTAWWIDGLVQLQGRVLEGRSNRYRGPGLLAFAWQKTGLPVSGAFARASWLQGTAWSAGSGETAGWLVWHYADGAVERVPMVYGQTTARFWADLDQLAGEKGYPEPAWKHHESAQTVGKERWLRLYHQTWMNPRPDVTVTSLDFVSNRECTAAPFLIAIRVEP